MSNVALYVRVSTEEQARHGLSVEAQQAALRAWAERNGHIIVGEYTDAGISGKKAPSKRPALSRLFADLEAGVKVDVLAFCKLDRFFRSVKLYYQAMETLDKYRVAWQAIQEDYETVTASGRMKVNIMLSVAENEADRTAERIKAVFDRKIALGQPVTRSQPLGFKVEGKRLVHDEYAPAALAAFEMYAKCGNVYAVRDMIQRDFGIRKPYEAVWRMLRNPLYIGQYRDNPSFCEPIISRELWNKVQTDYARRSTSRPASGRVYLFSGLIVCAECGRRWIAGPGGKDCAHAERYRCNGHLFGNTCPCSRYVNEYKLEQQLLFILANEVSNAEAESIPEKKKTPTVNRAAIQKRLDRLKDLFMEGDIELEEYRAKRDELTKKLSEPPPPTYKPIKIVGSDFMRRYETFDRVQKKAFWRSILDHVTIDRDLNIQVFFSE